MSDKIENSSDMNIENTVGKIFPESEQIFEKSNQLTEKLTELINSMVGKAAPIWIILPKLVISFCFYFKTGNDALKLPFAMW